MPANYERILAKLQLVDVIEIVLEITTHHVYTFRAIFEQQVSLNQFVLLIHLTCDVVQLGAIPHRTKNLSTAHYG